MLKKIGTYIYWKSIRLIPRNGAGDWLYSLQSFWLCHKRLPLKRYLFNNYLFQLKTSNEIIDPLRVFITDKEYLKIYVKAKVGDNFNVPTISILHSPLEVDTFIFPNRCCIKPTHASGEYVIRDSGEPLPFEKIKSWFSLNYYQSGREANYKYLRPKIIVEPLIFDSTIVVDYKFFCFNGVPKIIQVDLDRTTDHRRLLFDPSWSCLEFTVGYRKPDFPYVVPACPDNFNEMLMLAERLSSDFSLIRIDLYSDGGLIYVGEITNCHGNATERFYPQSGEIRFSRLLFGKT